MSRPPGGVPVLLCPSARSPPPPASVAAGVACRGAARMAKTARGTGFLWQGETEACVYVGDPLCLCACVYVGVFNYVFMWQGGDTRTQAPGEEAETGARRRRRDRERQPGGLALWQGDTEACVYVGDLMWQGRQEGQRERQRKTARKTGVYCPLRLCACVYVGDPLCLQRCASTSVFCCCPP